MSDSQRVGSRVSQKLFKKYSVLDRNKYFWQNIVVAGNGNKLKLCKTPLFQISGSAGSSTKIEQFKLKFWKFFWGSDSQIFHFIPLPHHPFKVSMEKNFNNVEITEINWNATWIKNSFSLLLDCFWSFSFFCVSFYQKSPICHQSHQRLLCSVLTCPLMANKCNNTFFPKPHQTVYYVTKPMKWNNWKMNQTWGKWTWCKMIQ